MTIFETKRLSFDKATYDDIDEIMDIENHKDNRKYIWQGTAEEHKKEITDPDYLLLVFRHKETKSTIGFALIHMDFKSNVFEIRRIAITRKKEGYGREAMLGLFKYAFQKTKTNRIWLDVYPDNASGIKLYESLGMHKDGILRQSYLSERGYLDQIIYSFLRSEYEERYKETI